MMNTRSKLIAMLLFGFLFAVGLPAKEKHLKKSDLPPAVQRTADVQSEGASVRGYASEIEDGNKRDILVQHIDDCRRLLGAVPTVKHLWAGRPAMTPRGMVPSSQRPLTYGIPSAAQSSSLLPTRATSGSPYTAATGILSLIPI